MKSVPLGGVLRCARFFDGAAFVDVDTYIISIFQ